MRALRLGISTCPNDTFAFHALLAGEVDTEGLAFEAELLDVEELNRGLAAGRFDVAKASFAAMLGLADELVVLPAGAALGFGVGPVVLASADGPPPADARVLAPGEHTTATLLWRLYGAELLGRECTPEQVVFSAIMPALEAGDADLGVCIHEGRFTWRERGLALFDDLGARWEADTGAPLPLGGIAARRELGADVAARAARAIRRSLEWGLAHRAACLPTMARWAQEASEAVLWGHVDLYVNAWTVELGDEGRRALRVLAERAVARGLAPARGLAVLVP